MIFKYVISKFVVSEIGLQVRSFQRERRYSDDLSTVYELKHMSVISRCLYINIESSRTDSCGEKNFGQNFFERFSENFKQKDFWTNNVCIIAYMAEEFSCIEQFMFFIKKIEAQNNITLE